MKNILVIGGTGTMGREVVRLFSESGYDTWVVCRSQHAQSNHVHYLYGNAMDDGFLRQILKARKYDAIVDFMWYDPDTFAFRIDQLLSATKHYICLSSSAVSAHSNEPIKEENPRFYDIASEEELNDSGWHYHLDKARIENIIRSQNRTNWTIIRPHVTLNSNHLPLTVWTESVWLWRATHNLPIIVYEDLLKPISSYTMASDVAKMIEAIIKKGSATHGETYNVVSDTVLSGEQLLSLYDDILRRHGYQMEIVRLSDSSSYHRFSPMGYERITYDRAQDRVFDNIKIKSIAQIEYADFAKSMEKCIEEWLFLYTHIQTGIENAFIEEFVLMDQLSKTRTPLRYLKSATAKKIYLTRRYPFVGMIYNAAMQPIVKLIKHKNNA